MKRIVFFIAIMIFASFCMTSCLKDTENTAEIHYTSMPDSLFFDDTTDVVWEENICEALAKLELSYNTFTMRDTTVSGGASSAVYNCDVKAVAYLQKQLAKVNLTDVKKTIFNSHADSLINVGYKSADEIPLDQFRMHVALYSYYYGASIWGTYCEVN